MMTDKYSQVYGMASRKSCRIAFIWLMWMMCDWMRHWKKLSKTKFTTYDTLTSSACYMCMHREVAKRQGLEWQLQAAAEDSQRQEMFCHHAEQEVKRVSALVEVRELATNNRLS